MARKAGRPRERSPELGKRAHLSIATPLPLKRQLERTAKTSGRSVSQEATARLEQSFDHDRLFGGAAVRHMILTIAVAFETAGRDHAKTKGIQDDWVRDPDCYLAALNNTLRALLREGPPDLSRDFAEAAVKSNILTRVAQDELAKGGKQ